MASYCTIADLELEMDPTLLAGLADDRAAEVPDLTHADTIAVINRHIEDQSNRVRAALLGRVDLTDSQVLADCRRLTVDLVVASLHARRYQFPSEVTSRAKAARDELKAIREGQLSTGTTEQKQLLAASTTEDRTPTFAPDSDGDDPSFMEGF